MAPTLARTVRAKKNARARAVRHEFVVEEMAISAGVRSAAEPRPSHCLRKGRFAAARSSHEVQFDPATFFLPNEETKKNMSVQISRGH
ncbi:hypothetical protein MTO96_006690 [Rhipicephalus appendiculatus]